jgi:hypothetical protein
MPARNSPPCSDRPLVMLCGRFAPPTGSGRRMSAALIAARCPGHAAARQVLARPFDDRLFFAGEATHRFDFSTAHGAYDSGVRAAEQAVASFAVVR